MERPQLPPVVYAPTVRSDDDTMCLRMQRMRDDRVSLFVYSAIDRLEQQYGEGSSWVLLSVPDLERAHQESPFDLLLFDRDLHPVEGGA